MKARIATVVLAAFLTGCVAQNGGSGAPSIVGGAGSSAPSDEETRQAYEDYRYRLICGDREDCSQLWRRRPHVNEVSQTECDAPRGSGERRCTFGVHEWINANTVVVHLCAGLFRREEDEWTMLSALRECQPPLPGRPAR